MIEAKQTKVRKVVVKEPENELPGYYRDTRIIVWHNNYQTTEVDLTLEEAKILKQKLEEHIKKKEGA